MSFCNKNYFKGNRNKIDCIFIHMSKGEAGLLQNQRNEGKSENSKVNASDLYKIREIRKFFFWMAQAAFS